MENHYVRRARQAMQYFHLSLIIVDVFKTYIVYMGSGKVDEVSALSLYKSMLQEVVDSKAAERPILHHYKRSFNGFVVKLTGEEVKRIAEMDGVVSVFPNEMKQLHTTRSWDFLGFPTQVERSTIESNIIIGVIDGGIWPESHSFDKKGLGPPPSKWKGSCQTSTNFTCNNKIVGAKYYKTDGTFSPEDLRSPRDSKGHGTHVASTAAGMPVGMASMLGFGLGTARGAVPSARIAVYKVCWHGCTDADILAAFDDAIADGVDILSVSLGGPANEQYFDDPVAIGAFHAMRNGILTVTSAGNLGPSPATLSNFSPWSISVGASTMDRKFVTKVELGDNKTYEGVSINTFDLKGDMYPLIYGGDAANSSGGSSLARYCFPNTLDPNSVKGKIVLCDGDFSSIAATSTFLAGAVGVLTQGETRRDSTSIFPLPGSYLNSYDGAGTSIYLNSTRNPTATIFKSEEVKNTLAPAVVSFSSRGPNRLTPDILKPDLVAPGVYVLASWSEISPISRVKGAAAYVKSFHPTWSPAAIKSALMTTAKPLSRKINHDAEFAYGAGQIDPIKAVNPGLVYDAGESDYINLLCAQGYTTRFLRRLTGHNSSCPETTNATARDLNYPSFALQTQLAKSTNATFKRTVTNVGSSVSTYKATVTVSSQGLKIQVNPSVLSFTSVGQKKTFELTIEGTIEETIASASLVWNDGNFQVRSPIVVYHIE
ncbi:hypothetical protein L6164_026515 [Bauhinia variegata]|uniref:Uncharacterized protein n=1 Tax=Bauhinia variegata TaxID=167791 RepID=A0ACB9LQM7_BAUVA|nr:hypothetical protein L6164_026515 [Bauhinia variegata]